MNVLYINHSILRSGAGISLSTLVRHLPAEVRPFFMLRRKCEIDGLLGAAPEQTFRERFMVEFMTTLYVSPYPLWLFLWHLLKTPLAFFRMRQLKRKWKPDLIHANESSLLIYVFAARLAGLPVVLHARTALAKRPFEQFLLWWIGHLRSTRILAIDHEVKASLPKKAQGITQVVYNPIELGAPPSPEEIAALRASWGFSLDHIVVGQIASLHAQKGVWLIMELAEHLCAEFPLLKFALIGDDSARAGEGPMLREAIKQKGLEDRIVLPGYETRLSLAYGALDIALCLFGGGLGGAGRAAYEAAVAGKPLVATLPDPATSETLRDGVTGLVFAPADHTGISNGLRRLITSPALRHSIGRSAQASIGSRHDPRAVARQVLELYGKLLHPSTEAFC